MSNDALNPAARAGNPSAAPTPSGRMRSRWTRRVLRLALALLIALMLLWLASAWLLPWLLTSYAPRWIKQQTQHELSVGEARFNPFSLRLHAKDVRLSRANQTLLSLNELRVKGAWSSLIDFAWSVDELTLSGLNVAARRDAGGALDWASFVNALAGEKSDSAASDSVPRLLLRNLAIESSAFTLTDESVRAGTRRIELAPIAFKLDKLSTLPRDRGDYAFDATLNDQTRIQWRGRLGGNPIESSGDLAVNGLPLAKVSTLLGVPLPVALTGTGSFKANYTAAVGTDFTAFGIGGGELAIDQFSATQGDDELRIAKAVVSPVSLSFARTTGVSGSAQSLFAVEPLRLNAEQVIVSSKDRKTPLLSISQLSTPTPVLIGASDRKVTVPKIIVSELKAQLNRASDGSVLLPFQDVETAPTRAQRVTSPPTSGAASNAWNVAIESLELPRAAMRFVDASIATPQVFDTTLTLDLGATAQLGESTRVSLAGKSLQLSDVTVRDELAATPWLGVKEIRADTFAWDTAARAVELPKLSINAPELKMRLEAGGLDVVNKFATRNVSRPSPPTRVNAATDTPSVVLNGIALSGGRVEVIDTTLPSPLTQALQALRIDVDRFALNRPTPIAARASAAIVDGGNVRVNARHDRARNATDIDFALDNLALAAWSPYLNRNTKLKIARGEASASGKVALAGQVTRGDGESLRIEGRASLSKVALIDENTNAPFAEWEMLASSNATITQQNSALRVNLSDVLLDQPRGKIVINEDRSVNLAQIAKTSAAATPNVTSTPPASASRAGEQSPSEARASAFEANVARVQVTGGDIEFADLSLRPQFGTRISDLSGLIVGLSTAPASRAEVSMEGKVDQFGLARLTGTIAPTGASEFTQLKALFRNLEMASLTPYSGKFAGRKIEAGKLSLDLDYRIEARRLKGENQLIIDNLKLGERVDSPEATQLPLDLAIALLRDNDGVIDLGIPVQGSLDDPQFSYGSLIWKAIVNVLTKVATAPFRALGALLGGSGEEFEAVAFPAGEARLLPPEREKLAKLVAALEKRPALKLSIEPRYDRTADRDALADNLVKLEIGKRAGLKPPGPNEPLIVSFTDPKVQAALDEMAASAGDDAVALRAKFLPPASNAVAGLLQGARERLTERGRNEAAEARGRYYPELFALLKSKQTVPDIAFETLATLRGQAISNTLTGVNKFDPARVSLAAAQATRANANGEVASKLALSVK